MYGTYSNSVMRPFTTAHVIFLGTSIIELELSGRLESARALTKANKSTWLTAAYARNGDLVIVRKIGTLLAASKLDLFLAISAHF